MNNCYYYRQSDPNQRFGGFLIPFVGGLLIGGLSAPYFMNRPNVQPMPNYNTYQNQYPYNYYYPTYQYGTFNYPYTNGYYHY